VGVQRWTFGLWETGRQRLQARLERQVGAVCSLFVLDEAIAICQAGVALNTAGATRR